MILKFSLFVTIFLVYSCSTANREREVKDWRKESDKISRSYADSIGAFSPEEYSVMGISKFDSKAVNYSRTYDNELYSLAYKWNQRFEALLETTTHPELRTDLEILKMDSKQLMEGIELEREAGVIPFLSITEDIHYALKFNLAPEAPEHKKNSAMMRFRTYVRGDNNQLPLIDGFMSYMVSKMNYLAENKKRGFWPLRSEVENYINTSSQNFEAIESLLKNWKGEGWQRDLEELKRQDEDYRTFLRKKVLPYCRKSSLIPQKVYAHYLKEYGVDDSPKGIIEMGLTDYKKTYILFRKLAKKVAQKHKLSSSDPLSVISFLRILKLTKDEDIYQTYDSAARYNMELIRKHKLLTVKDHPRYVLRFMEPVEMRALPAPHFIVPSIFSPSKMEGQFLIPRVDTDNPMDDYSYREAIIDLTAHEAIPGHALQFQVIKEKGTTLARAFFAHNSVNVEGWALYAEKMIYPYMDDETKLVIIQRILWRQARTFLDPQVNLGLVRPDRVREVFVDELGFSRAFAESELRRYTSLMPGQAPSYYYGYRIIQDAKKKIKARPGMVLSEACFNDAFLAFGIVPLKLISDRLVKNLNCAD